MKVYREETPKKGKTPRGVRNEVRLQRTNRQPSISQLRSRLVTACCKITDAQAVGEPRGWPVRLATQPAAIATTL
jgi:hypothetical protein